MSSRWRDISARLLGPGAEEEILHLAREILPGTLIGEIEAVFVDEHGLVLHPGRPRLLAHGSVDALAQLTRIGREIETFGLALEIYALHRSCHVVLRGPRPR